MKNIKAKIKIAAASKAQGCQKVADCENSSHQCTFHHLIHSHVHDFISNVMTARCNEL